MKKKLIYLFIITLISQSLTAKIFLPSFWSDNMVIQQLSSNTIKGIASPNKVITFKTSWSKKAYKTKSDTSGHFAITFTTPAHGGPHSISISDGEVLTLNNVLIGDVWLCSGQSNMEMPLKGFKGQPVFHSQEKIIAANPTQDLRLLTVKRAYSTTPQDTIIGNWAQSSPKTAAEFSATAYFFGDLVQKTMNIPIGLIHSSWSASKIEAWISKEVISQFDEVDLKELNQEKFSNPNTTPTLLYNAMINPLDGISIKGIIWYQGESNSQNPSLYKKLFAAWVDQNRSLFKNPELPIYYVQIAPYKSSNKDDINLPLFREAQMESMKEINNVGMAFTTDIGDEVFIHSPHKKQVGERLAYWALAKTYNIEGFPYSGPIYKSYELKDNKITIKFDHADTGLNPENTNITGFEIAGVDGNFVKAEAKIINGSSSITVWSDQIESPKEVRYCFRNYTTGNLTNNAGIPASAFRLKIK